MDDRHRDVKQKIQAAIERICGIGHNPQTTLAAILEKAVPSSDPSRAGMQWADTVTIVSKDEPVSAVGRDYYVTLRVTAHPEVDSLTVFPLIALKYILKEIIEELKTICTNTKFVVPVCTCMQPPAFKHAINFEITLREHDIDSPQDPPSEEKDETEAGPQPTKKRKWLSIEKMPFGLDKLFARNTHRPPPVEPRSSSVSPSYISEVLAHDSRQNPTIKEIKDGSLIISRIATYLKLYVPPHIRLSFSMQHVKRIGPANTLFVCWKPYYPFNVNKLWLTLKTKKQNPDIRIDMATGIIYIPVD